ncbi:hypothetical protein [Ehrlichia minasensis]|uniref:hypothetical protein n=1 Tax=Ehrlichia minasensis TaxID=1242993 RepID=UPI000B21A34E|nr:hypothetical protein [Ehrlichia minasensis]
MSYTLLQCCIEMELQDTPGCKLIEMRNVLLFEIKTLCQVVLEKWITLFMMS